MKNWQKTFVQKAQNNAPFLSTTDSLKPSRKVDGMLIRGGYDTRGYENVIIYIDKQLDSNHELFSNIINSISKIQKNVPSYRIHLLVLGPNKQVYEHVGKPINISEKYNTRKILKIIHDLVEDNVSLNQTITLNQLFPPIRNRMYNPVSIPSKKDILLFSCKNKKSVCLNSEVEKKLKRLKKTTFWFYDNIDEIQFETHAQRYDRIENQDALFKEFIEIIPDELKRRSGAVFYSGRNAFSTVSSIYVLGLNPGGMPEDRDCPKNIDHINSVLYEKPADWSEYKDEVWKSGSDPGKSGLQPRVLHLFSEIKLNPYRVPSSNLIFLRSRGEEGIQDNFDELAELCWPFHQKVLDRLKITTILCFGQKAGKWVCGKLDAHKQIGSFVELNKRKWVTAAFENEGGKIKVIVATHPSRADWKSPKTDPTQFIKKIVKL